MTSGIELGRVVDVILDEAGERPVGFDVLCGDGSHRFLPFPTARLGGEHVEVDSLVDAARAASSSTSTAHTAAPLRA